MPIVGQRTTPPEPPSPAVAAPGPRLYWSTTDGKTVRLYLGHVIDALRGFPDQSVHCVVTSPPYWGLRDYGTGMWEGGDPACDHVKTPTSVYKARPGWRDGRQEPDPISYSETCGKCGAVRIDQQLGSEPSPDCGTHGQAQCGRCFVCSMVAVFREVRRVLRDDGTLWLNLGDSYASGEVGRHDTLQGDGVCNGTAGVTGKSGIGTQPLRSSGKTGLPSGNLVGVPWRVALALQADGWILRQDIIWAKPSPMPESVKNRCTKAHEYVFLLTKKQRYFYDAEAIKEKSKEPGVKVSLGEKSLSRYSGGTTGNAAEGVDFVVNPSSSNKRSVWTVPRLPRSPLRHLLAEPD